MSLLNALKKSDMKPGSRSWRIASLAPKRLNTASSYASATVCADAGNDGIWSMAMTWNGYVATMLPGDSPWMVGRPFPVSQSVHSPT
ncbi:hypothetical protein PR002_g30772 [Phytophthora rubi]|uniref:Uncharacterized protein n=1 Tax=Phytophthora rubi TaxID=129364 RepID=A0A6A3GQB5_9STRA|nr:hypothetical protein PR002_g30772 [Phytophthora rubi]